MFSRSEVRSDAGLIGRLNGASPPPAKPTTEVRSATSPQAISIIGRDLTIVGMDLRISSNGTVQIDGDVQGEVSGRQVIIGETGKVTGTVYGLEVVVRGRVYGLLQGERIILQASSHVEGDIHNNALIIEQGAQFDGRCHRLAQPFELVETQPG